MSAAIAYMDRLDAHLRREELQSELNQWGRWIERTSEFQGYPGVDVLESFLNGGGGDTSGHKILCLEMPCGLWSIHHRILRLEEIYQQAVWIWYVFRLKPDGTLWTRAEQCATAKVSEETMRVRLHRAKLQLLGIKETT